jgi:hypothetical protein
MPLHLMTRLLVKSGKIYGTFFSTSSIIRTTSKPSVLLVNHGYPPLFNAGSEVKLVFIEKIRKNI